MTRKRQISLVFILLLLGLGGWFGWKAATRPWSPSADVLTTPKQALAALKGPTVFFTPPARQILAAAHPDFFPAGTRDALSPVSRKLAQAGPDPRSFRELDRDLRFFEVWLAGDVTSFKALLEHLLATKDFGVVYVDHTSIILRRGVTEEWKPANSTEAAAQFKDPRERAWFQAQYATRLTAIGRPDAATAWLEAAAKNAPEIVEVWTAWSTQRMAKGDWNEALKYAEKALAIDPENLSAIACKAQSLYAVKRFSEAHDLSKLLIAANPDDPAILFYHAKLSHEAHAYQSEIKALSKLIEIGEKAEANVSGYRIYLAQAYAAIDDAEGAMDQVTLALLDTSLPKEQRQFADELLTQIKKASDK